jgi:hypothetical protein
VGLRIIDQVDNADPSDYGAGHTRQTCQTSASIGLSLCTRSYRRCSPTRRVQ